MEEVNYAYLMVFIKPCSVVQFPNMSTTSYESSSIALESTMNESGFKMAHKMTWHTPDSLVLSALNFCATAKVMLCVHCIED